MCSCVVDRPPPAAVALAPGSKPGDAATGENCGSAGLPVGNDSGSALPASGDTANDEEYLDEEGRPLSAYEILRLERIKRNREKLAQLGLGQEKVDQGVLGGGAGADGDAKKSKPARPRKSEEAVPQRARSSRASKKNLNYAEPSISVRALLKKAGESDDEETRKPSGVKPSKDTTAPVPAEDTTAPVPSERKRKWDQDRLPQDIYREFKRIRSYKRDLLIEAQRAVRSADKEIRYWTKRVDQYQKTFLRKKDETDEKLALGGITSRELLQIVDVKAPEIQEAVRNYEEFLYADQREHQRAAKQKEAEEKMKLMDALVRFPKALKVRHC
jgi:hypothetical protein